MGQRDDYLTTGVDLDGEFARILKCAHASGVLAADLNVDRLRPLFGRIVCDLQRLGGSPERKVALEMAATDAGVLWSRTAQLLNLSFDAAFRFATLLLHDLLQGQEGLGPALSPSFRPNHGLLGLELSFASTSDEHPYIPTFLCSLSKEWMRLDLLPYHRKLREVNRYILLEKRRYYTIFNRMSEPAFIVDNELGIVECNKAFNAFFHLSGKDAVRKHCCEVVGEELCRHCGLDNLLEKHSSFSGLEAEVVIDGHTKNLVLSGAFLGEINSDVLGGIIILQDITMRKTIERSLQESEERYRSLIENVPDVTWRSDLDGSFYYISPNLVRLCGYDSAEFMGPGAYNKFSLIHPEDVDVVRNEFGCFFASHLPDGDYLRRHLRDLTPTLGDLRIVSGRKRYDVTYRMKRKDGSWMWVHDRASTIYEQDGGWFADGVLADVTELKQAEAELERHHFLLAELVDERTVELRRVNENLKKEIFFRKQAEKDLLELASKLKLSNNELEQFAHVASHDLKEPLMLIRAFSERLLRKYLHALDERGEDYLKRIIAAANRMFELIEGLLSLSRIASSEQEYESINLARLLDEVIENLGERIRETDGKVELEVMGDLGGDRVQLRQLFQNIIANSLKFRKEGKSPRIKVTSALVGDGLCEIVIADDGIGFDSCHSERIFRPMERLHSRKDFEGTGLGLATCRKIVIRHGGEIEAKGEPGKGAIFTIRLPVGKEAEMLKS